MWYVMFRSLVFSYKLRNVQITRKGYYALGVRPRTVHLCRPGLLCCAMVRTGSEELNDPELKRNPMILVSSGAQLKSNHRLVLLCPEMFHDPYSLSDFCT